MIEPRKIEIQATRDQREVLHQYLYGGGEIEVVATGGTRRGGKSWSGAHCIGFRRLMFPGTRAICIRTIQKASDMNMGEELKNAFFRPYGFEIGLRNKGKIQFLEGDNQFRFPNGSLIQLGYCRHIKDLEPHLGVQWDDIWIEQAEQHTERVFDRFKGSNFPNHPVIKPRMLLTFNPGGIGSEWLERRIVNPATRDKRVVWVKSSIRNCYATLEKDPSYIQRVLLKIQDAVLRAQWLDGDWDAQHGLYFRMQTAQDETGPTIREMQVPYWADILGGVDWGEHSPFAYLIAAHWRDPDKNGKPGKQHLHIMGEVYEKGLHLDQQAERALAKERELRRKYPYMHDVRQRWADPSTGTAIERESLEQTRSKASVWQSNGFDTYPAFRYSRTSGLQLMKYLIRKGILTIDPECMGLIKEMRSATRKEDSEDIDPRNDDHACDSGRYLVTSIFDLDYSEEPDEMERWELARLR